MGGRRRRDEPSEEEYSDEGEYSDEYYSESETPERERDRRRKGGGGRDRRRRDRGREKRRSKKDSGRGRRRRRGDSADSRGSRRRQGSRGGGGGGRGGASRREVKDFIEFNKLNDDVADRLLRVDLQVAQLVIEQGKNVVDNARNANAVVIQRIRKHEVELGVTPNRGPPRRRSPQSPRRPPPAPAPRMLIGTGEPGFKEGDWYCKACDAHNFSKRVDCFKCGRPKESPPPAKESAPPETDKRARSRSRSRSN